MKRITIILALLITGQLFAQQDTTKGKVSFSGYIEAYYTYDFNNPANHERPGFVYSHNKHNEFNVNIAFLKLNYAAPRVRANVALMAGSYAHYNLAAEQALLKNIFEANAGYKVCNKANLWVDAGIFASHIGFESAIGKDCWNLTRSILADNSPYYESGVKLSYTSPSEKWFISGLVLNGWQRIARPTGNQTPAFGHQLTFKPNSKITLNSSSFIGNDKPDSTRQMRYFHNFYGQFLIGDKMGIIAGFDIGAEQKAKGSSEYNVWYSPVVILRYAFNPVFAAAARAEYYSDKNGAIIATGTPNGFQTLGYSANLDFNFTPNIVWRVEGRLFQSKDKIFTNDGGATQYNPFVATSLAVSF